MQRISTPTASSSSDVAPSEDLAASGLPSASLAPNSHEPRANTEKHLDPDLEDLPMLESEPTLADEFERLNHRRPTRTEERFLETIVEPSTGNSPLWFEGSVPEAIAALAAFLVDCAGKRILLLGAERGLVAARETRFSTRLPLRRVTSSERASRLPKGPLLVLSSFENIATLPRRLAGEKFDLVFVESAEAITSDAPEYRPILGKVPSLVERCSARVVYFSRFLTDAAKGNAHVSLGLAGKSFSSFVEDLETPELRFAMNAGIPELLAVIEELPRPALVLCATPTGADLAFAALEAEQVPCHRFHAAMSPSERASELLQFALPGRRAVLVATSSFAPEASAGQAPRFLEHFGRGYGRADLRSIIHVGLPASLEQLGSEYGLLSRTHAEKSQVLILVEDASSEKSELSEDDPVLAVLSKKRPNGEALEAVLLVLTSKAKGAVFQEEEILGAAGVGRSAARLALSLLVEAGLVLATQDPVRSYELAIEELTAKDASPRRNLKENLLERARVLGEALDGLFGGDVERRTRLLAFAHDSSKCRRLGLLSYFGFARRSGDESSSPCGVCDVCAPLACVESTSTAEALRAFYRSRAPEDRRARSGEELDGAFDAPASGEIEVA